MLYPAFLSVLRVATLAALPVAAAAVEITIDPNAGRTPISPLVYGSNAALEGVRFPLRRQGGNRMTGYNWENNASNAGHDYRHQSDNYLTWVVGIPDSQANTPGIVMTHYHDQVLADSARYSIITVPMAGYVAADKINRGLFASEAAPSVRWVAVENTKPTALSLVPDVTDARVYSDEMVNFLVNRYGSASGPRGVKAYSLDNEPDLWSDGQYVNGQVALENNATHPLIHPAKPRAAELITRSVDLAKAIKRVDPAAEVVGFASYGFGGYSTFQSAPDWDTEKAKGSYRWFIDYFLDQMRQASTTAGVRLLDVMDLHNYSEARGGGVRVNDTTDYTNTAANEARMQSPRSFWDSTYIEDSWIGRYNVQFLPWLPNIKQSIDAFYPGTKLMIGEYNFGGEGHISGGIAQADILGILGENGVYAAALWPFSGSHTYSIAAFKLYLDYDGAESKFGDTAVSATWAERALCSVHAAAESGDPTRLHVIVLNKSTTAAAPVDLSIAGTTTYRRARVFAFDSASATITERDPIPTITGNRFTYSLPALTAAHFVLDASLVRADPAVRQVVLGGGTSFSAGASGLSGYQWRHNGTDLTSASATAATLTLADIQPANTGLYSVQAGGNVSGAGSDPVILGLSTTSKFVGSGEVVGTDIEHPNGNIFDQVLLTGAAEAVTADYAQNQITRTSFIDVDGDIVQVEFSGPGTLSLVLDAPTGRATPEKYHQLDVEYMKGHAGIVITGADERTNISVFTVGRATAFDPSGQFNFLQPITAANNPANNGSPLFVGHDSTEYDGHADIAFIAISSLNGKFGGVRTANTTYFARRGYTGLYAPGVAFSGPVFIGDITAFESAQPVIMLGAASDTRITGGDLSQGNGRAVRVSGLTQLRFTDGSDSHGHTLTAQVNHARLEQNGVDVTAAVVVNPTP
ncbi:glycoside hydrolase family 44 protein [Opitutus terrae]|uniref:Glycoside hydrolase family 44 catalytic domain-containing protein n=1 Tax=Opitutus terrae (strain DSM 11246 / JCM 15787 / PB90-1) TaxID=452637 RepID=B1ZP88_OPITP|nr:glycoside hydrolase family 44 protein [Opitutus terrae]ACB77577.1 hypothetical protein Oter_4304 [Opitutus terrae PB90-1]